jgi:hypothetical protein
MTYLTKSLFSFALVCLQRVDFPLRVLDFLIFVSDFPSDFLHLGLGF